MLIVITYVKEVDLHSMTYPDDTVEIASLEERQYFILEKIEQNPGIHHNALKRMVVEQPSKPIMATKTFDKLVHELIEEGKIAVQKDGNKKRYFLPDATIAIGDFAKEIKIQSRTMIDHVNDLQREFRSMTTYYKGLNSIFALDSCNNVLMLVSFYSSFFDDSESFASIEKQARQYIKTIFEMAAKDKHRTILIPALRAHILKQDINDIMQSPRMF